jgi:hypothetical protein
MLLKAKQLPSSPLTPPLARTTQANPFLEKAWMQETSCWQTGLSETKVILGWFFDFGKLQISLPKNKFITWTENVSKLIAEGTTTTKELELMIGQLGHLALVVPGVHHFLSHHQELQQRAANCRSIQISGICQDDLTVMLCFLDIAKIGINMNLIAFCQPTHVY